MVPEILSPNKTIGIIKDIAGFAINTTFSLVGIAIPGTRPRHDGMTSEVALGLPTDALDSVGLPQKVTSIRRGTEIKEARHIRRVLFLHGINPSSRQERKSIKDN